MFNLPRAIRNLSRSITPTLRQGMKSVAARPSIFHVSSIAPIASASPINARFKSTGTHRDGGAFELTEEFYGANRFGQREMERYLPKSILTAYEDCLKFGRPITEEIADAIAAALHHWARERGVTHYTHWFHPLTSATAQKHDTFLKVGKDGHVSSQFKGKSLIIGEPDSSSFPNGGMRPTHQARGYTVWDPTSPPFVVDHGNGATLFIPSVFFTWKGEAQDEKIPLLRSQVAVEKYALQLLRVLGETHHNSVHCDSGVEQEYFFIDREHYNRRPDIMAGGRSLLGSPPPKGQELSDLYFGDLSERILECIKDCEEVMWKLGIPATTRHREVAPGQYEFAPIFAKSSIASDTNMLMMEVITKSARRHGLEALFHEKPFKDLNGSGKHNNWSIGTDSVGSLFEPGDTPEKNTRFLAFLCATLRGLDLHQDLIRIAVSGAGNDHRLGGHEAPPAIISAYLGDDLSAALDTYLNGTKKVDVNLNLNLGIPFLPTFQRAPTDRNRTSPFAFTGNKFEFRAVGSSQPPARSNHVLNTLLAESCKYLAEEISKRKAGGSKDPVNEVLRETFKKHSRIIFNGNGYSDEWKVEAGKRGLLNLLGTPEALKLLNNDKNVTLFESMGVLTRRELEARQDVFLCEYSMKIQVEATSFSQIISQRIIPFAIDAQTRLSGAINSVASVAEDSKEKFPSSQQNQLLLSLVKETEALIQSNNNIVALERKMDKIDNVQERADLCRKEIVPALKNARKHADAIEGMFAADEFPLPNYHEMLFSGQL